MATKIAIIDDVPDETLKQNLENEGYEVAAYSTGNEGIQNFIKNTPDLLLLDLVLPQKSGYEILREIREKKFQFPIIIISQKNTLTDKVVCLEIGADDFVTKPFAFEELNARIKARLRRNFIPEIKKSIVVEVNGLKIDIDNYYVEKDGEEIRLSNYEFEILRCLLSKRGKPVAREELIDKIWENKIYISSRTIDNHIVNLRKKIEENYKRPKFILTVYRKGYKFKY